MKWKVNNINVLDYNEVLNALEGIEKVDENRKHNLFLTMVEKKSLELLSVYEQPRITLLKKTWNMVESEKVQSFPIISKTSFARIEKLLKKYNNIGSWSYPSYTMSADLWDETISIELNKQSRKKLVTVVYDSNIPKAYGKKNRVQTIVKEMWAIWKKSGTSLETLQDETGIDIFNVLVEKEQNPNFNIKDSVVLENLVQEIRETLIIENQDAYKLTRNIMKLEYARLDKIIERARAFAHHSNKLVFKKIREQATASNISSHFVDYLWNPNLWRKKLNKIKKTNQNRFYFDRKLIENTLLRNLYTQDFTVLVTRDKDMLLLVEYFMKQVIPSLIQTIAYKYLCTQVKESGQRLTQRCRNTWTKKENIHTILRNEIQKRSHRKIKNHKAKSRKAKSAWNDRNKNESILTLIYPPHVINKKKKKKWEPEKVFYHYNIPPEIQPLLHWEITEQIKEIVHKNFPSLAPSKVISQHL